METKRVKQPIIRLKRIYEPESPDDGWRVLVDRLWPRGIKKETAHVDLWYKELAPSNELRKAFHQGIDNFADFAQAYRQELAARPELQQLALQAVQHQTVTLLFAAKDEAHNNAVVLQHILEEICPTLEENKD